MPPRIRSLAEYVHLNQPPRGVEQTAGEHDVPDDLPILLGNQRETSRRGDGLPQGIDQTGHDQTVITRAVITERPHVEIPYILSVAGKFFAKVHAGMVGTLPVARTRFLIADMGGQKAGHPAPPCGTQIASP